MLADGSGDYLPVATTRPRQFRAILLWLFIRKTRFAKFVGKMVLGAGFGQEIPVVADDYVNKSLEPVR